MQKLLSSYRLSGILVHPLLERVPKSQRTRLTKWYNQGREPTRHCLLNPYIQPRPDHLRALLAPQMLIQLTVHRSLNRRRVCNRLAVVLVLVV